MQFDVPDRWVLLELAADKGTLSVRYRDDRHRVRPPVESAQPWPASAPLLSKHLRMVALPRDLGLLLAEQASELPSQRVGPHAGRPVPLPVFLNIPPILAEAQWERLDFLFGDSWVGGFQRVQAVRLARRRWRRRRPLSLPLRVIGIGVDSKIALTDFGNKQWLFSPEVKEYGLELHPMDSMATTETVFGWDIVVADSEFADEVIRMVSAKRRPPGMPRLLVIINPAQSHTGLPIPSGLSLLTVESHTPSQFFTEFLYGIVHDYPLHEATKAGWDTAGESLLQPPHLFADPASNQDLRISDALVTMVRQARELETVAALPADVTGFLSRAAPEGVLTSHASLRHAAEIGQSVIAGLGALALRTDFRQEGTGLIPMAQARANLSHAQKTARLMLRELRRAGTEPWTQAAMRKHQQRRVDVALERMEYSPLLLAGIPIEQALRVDGRTVLRAGARYRLTVRIGGRFTTSLIRTQPPPIDPLLPGVGTQQLEVVVFGLDFAVVGQHARVFLLPELGASPLVSFVVRTPEREGNAQLRIGIYHENHIVQSFLLQALIDQQERRADRDVLVATLELSRSRRFTNLEELRPRALSVGINQSPAGTHSLMIKRDGHAQAFSFQWQSIDQHLKDFRRLLAEATTAPGGAPRYPVGRAPASGSQVVFEQTVRDLAKLGKDLYDGLWQRARALEETLRSLARSGDKPIQIVRFDVNNVLPWSVMYDYPLPRPVVGQPPVPICLGWGEGVEPGDPPAKHCRHGPGRPGYCIYGFWGVRHVIEELLVASEADGDTEPCLRITRNSLQESVWLSVDQDDAFTQDLRSQLDRALGAGVLRQVGAGEDLISHLWQRNERPALLIVLGHLELRDLPEEPPGARIVLPGPAWLQPQDITQRTQDDGRWRDEPHPLTLLMACGSGATDATTLNDFVLALTDAGASAVVGTETTAFSGLAAFFAQEIASNMWKPQGASLGESIKDFRRRLMTQRNPLGFVFSSFGSADVTITS